ncbi:hypothetical protein OOK39_02185 [Streptomyces sp. NBC_00264]|uniref:hypothetical protein n=1 Tax=unclassified Streptomyces TaxID=2593676 RepID=UPI00224C8ED5|nr:MULTISPECIES: hypothetical protein [unclassified Streptomyces]MCX5158109.1 hypothetical protein [Streptomyces sp. NBC_00305]MCX5216632.1 hypothetical protein [Streptomyces sp. NBC_00264]
MSTATPTQSTALMSPAAADNRQARHALTALVRTTPGRRRVIQAAAEEYLSQIDRRRLPLGWGQPITDDHFNRADAYEMRRGNAFARMLGISCRPSDPQLPDTARAVLAAIDAAPRRLTDLARTTGQPALVALLHMVGTVPALSSADAAEQQRDW